MAVSMRHVDEAERRRPRGVQCPRPGQPDRSGQTRGGSPSSLTASWSSMWCWPESGSPRLRRSLGAGLPRHSPWDRGARLQHIPAHERSGPVGDCLAPLGVEARDNGYRGTRCPRRGCDTSGTKLTWTVLLCGLRIRGTPGRTAVASRTRRGVSSVCPSCRAGAPGMVKSIRSPQGLGRHRSHARSGSSGPRYVEHWLVELADNVWPKIRRLSDVSPGGRSEASARRGISPRRRRREAGQ